jgi:hypothetical protein
LDSTADVLGKKIPVPSTEGQAETGLIIGRAPDPGKNANETRAIMESFLADRSRAEKARHDCCANASRPTDDIIGTAGNNPAF